jgi:plastocyanin
MTMKGTLSLAALALVLALVLTSCGGGSSGGSSAGGGSGGGSGTSQGTTGKVIKTIAIKETEYKLSPSSVTLSKPGTYAFKAENNGSTQHSLTIEGKGVKGDEVELEQALSPGQSGVLTVTFLKSGTYEMYCPVDGHEQEGMKGKVVVK